MDALARPERIASPLRGNEKGAEKQPSVVPEDLDIDPGWYPGQLETAEVATPPESKVPTVLQKLQKWGDYQSVGAQVWPTRFVPMKTPLSKEILEHWSLPCAPKYRLTVQEMLQEQRQLGRTIGLILDLSNHDCLYTRDIPSDVEYCHIQLVAKELPPRSFVDAVVAAAGEFWRRKPDQYIAIHCAYGFNRTGFVVCCYLIEVCGLSVEDALQAFTTARPPGVKHEAFRRELHRRYQRPDRCCIHAALGSPDDNSSFGCSPNFRDLHLSDHGISELRASPLSRGFGMAGTPLQGEGLVGRSQLAPAGDSVYGTPATPPCTGGAASSSAPGTSGRLGSSGNTPGWPYSGEAGNGTMQRQQSSGENESLGASERVIMQQFRQHAQTIPEEGSPSPSPRASPLHAPDAHGLSSKFQRKSITDICWDEAAANADSNSSAPQLQLGKLHL